MSVPLEQKENICFTKGRGEEICQSLKQRLLRLPLYIWTPTFHNTEQTETGQLTGDKHGTASAPGVCRSKEKSETVVKYINHYTTALLIHSDAQVQTRFSQWEGYQDH